MKLVTTFIQSFMLDHVTQALNEIEKLSGMTVQNVLGHGRTRGKEAHEFRDQVNDFVGKVRLDIFVSDEILGQVVDAIQASGHTGNKGDGKIYVLPVENAVRISTNERGAQAV